MYYIYDNGQQIGPLTIEQLKKHNLSPQSRIWHEGLTEWGKVQDFPEIASALSLQLPDRKPHLNGWIWAMAIIMPIIPLQIYSELASDSDSFGTIFTAIILVFMFIYYVSILMLMKEKYKIAKVLAIIGCCIFVPIGLIGIIGVTKAIDKATTD